MSNPKVTREQKENITITGKQWMLIKEYDSTNALLYRYVKTGEPFRCIIHPSTIQDLIDVLEAAKKELG